MTLVNVYVPKVGHEHTLAAGSGIVGLSPNEQADRFPWVERHRVLAFYEGNIYGWDSMARYADRVFHAADRMLWGERGYPTIAKAIFDRDELLWVGTFEHPDGGLDIGESEKIAAWLGVDYLDDSELTRSQR